MPAPWPLKAGSSPPIFQRLAVSPAAQGLPAGHPPSCSRPGLTTPPPVVLPRLSCDAKCVFGSSLPPHHSSHMGPFKELALFIRFLKNVFWLIKFYFLQVASSFWEEGV